MNFKNMGEISFHNYASSPLAQRMVNTGHSVMIDICDVKSRYILSLRQVAQRCAKMRHDAPNKFHNAPHRDMKSNSHFCNKLLIIQSIILGL